MEKLNLKGFRLGDTYIKSGLCLAPMAGVTDRSFREICREMGAELTVSEMVSAKALCFEQTIKKKNTDVARTAPLADVMDYELPMSVQLFGSEPQYIAEAVRIIASGEYFGRRGNAIPTAIDINMGCPVPKVVGNGEGSALMKNPTLAGEIIRAATSASSLPITVKMRAGWDENSINAPLLAKIAEENGAAAVFVHGRTRKQMYAPSADYRVIADVKRCVGIPVIGNGDIYEVSDAYRMYEATGCDGIMIGRGALGNPWLFEAIGYALRGEEYSYPTIKERLDTAMRQVMMMIEEKGEYTGIREARKQLSWYMKGVRGAANARFAINSAETLDDIKKITDSLCEDKDIDN